MKETLLTLVTLLARKEFKERYGASKGGLELLFY